MFFGKYLFNLLLQGWVDWIEARVDYLEKLVSTVAINVSGFYLKDETYTVRGKGFSLDGSKRLCRCK